MNRHELTLPAMIADGYQMDPKEACATGTLFAEYYSGATPFPHIVLDSFLPPEVLQRAMDNFPVDAMQQDKYFEINYGGHHKRQVLPYDCNHEVKALFNFFNSNAVLQFLEGLTGITGLIPDPYFTGAGFHEISRGGLLGIHADFRINEQLHLERRLNLLVYLNPDWKEEWGGQLELWDKSMTACCSKVFPILNRCVVFSTDADSYHGHPDPLNCPEDVKRRSIALYYYTSSKRVYDEVPRIGTMYYARPTDGAATHAEARRFRVDQQIIDWMPPRLSRFFFKVRHRIRRLRAPG